MATTWPGERDGTLWARGNNNQNQLGNGPGPNHSDFVRVGTNRDWHAVSTTRDFNWEQRQRGGSLRSNRTLWTWGVFNYLTNGTFNSTNIPFPVQLCRESNWIGCNGQLEGGALCQTGESWSLSPATGLPGAGVPIASIGHLLSSSAAMTAFGPLFTTNWSYARYEASTNGTLWTTP